MAPRPLVLRNRIDAFIDNRARAIIEQKATRRTARDANRLLDHVEIYSRNVQFFALILFTPGKAKAPDQMRSGAFDFSLPNATYFAASALIASAIAFTR